MEEHHQKPSEQSQEDNINWRKYIIFFTLFIAVIGFFIGKSMLKEAHFKHEIESYVDNGLRETTELFKDFRLSGGGYEYLVLTFDDKFNDLERKEKYDLLKGILRQYDHKRVYIEDKYGKLNRSSLTDYASLTVMTNKGKYSIDHRGDYWDVDGKQYTEADFMIANDQSQSKQSSQNNHNSSFNKPLEDTNGNDWVEMNLPEKADIVLHIMENWEKSGSKILVDNNWFINELNDFYGDTATNSTNVPKAMSMLAVAGKVVQDN